MAQFSWILSSSLNHECTSSKKYKNQIFIFHIGELTWLCQQEHAKSCQFCWAGTVTSNIHSLSRMKTFIHRESVAILTNLSLNCRSRRPWSCMNSWDRGQGWWWWAPVVLEKPRCGESSGRDSTNSTRRSKSTPWTLRPCTGHRYRYDWREPLHTPPHLNTSPAQLSPQVLWKHISFLRLLPQCCILV